MDTTPPAYVDVGPSQPQPSTSSLPHHQPFDEIGHLFSLPEPAEASLTTDLPSGVAWKPNFETWRPSTISQIPKGCLVFHHPSLQEPRTLHDFIRRHAGIAPKLSVQIRGWHRKIKEENSVHGESVEKDGTRVVNDFNFCIDLTPHLPSAAQGTHGRISLTTHSPYAPGCRGSTKVTYHPDVMQHSQSSDKYAPLAGDPDTTSGAVVSREQRKSWTSHSKKRVDRGLPISNAWNKDAFKQIQSETALQPDTESVVGSEAASADLMRWCEAYCSCDKPLKEFHFVKTVYGWDREALTIAIKDLIASTDFRGDGVTISFETEDWRMIIKPNTLLSKLTSYGGSVLFLMCITLVHPAILLYFNFFGGAIFDGPLAQYPLQLYLPVSPDDKVTPPSDRVSGGPDDDQTYVHHGLSEREFLKEWKDAIKEAVRERVNGGRELDRPDPERSESLARRIAAVTEGL